MLYVVSAVKVAVTVASALTVIVHWLLVTESQPVHCENAEPAAGVAVSVTTEPLAKGSLQSPGHVMLGGEATIVPVPVPFAAAVSVCEPASPLPLRGMSTSKPTEPATRAMPGRAPVATGWNVTVNEHVWLCV